MAEAGVQISGVRGAVDEAALAQGRLTARIDALTLRLNEAAVRAVLPAGKKVRLDGITPAGIALRVPLSFTDVRAVVRVFPLPGGKLGLEPASVQTDLLSVPISLVAAALREFVPDQPWLKALSGGRWEVDLRVLAGPFGVELAPIVRASCAPGALEIRMSNEDPLEVAAAGDTTFLKQSILEAASAPLTTGEAAPGTPPPPGRLFLCPDPDCDQIIGEKDTICRHCALPLRHCPECGAPAARNATHCSAKEPHALPKLEPWSAAGGNAARTGARAVALPARAEPGWSYAPADGSAVGGSPVLAYGMVFASEGGDVSALDEKTGRLLWRFPLPKDHRLSGPGVSAGSDRVFLTTERGLLLAIEPLRGRQIWTARLPHAVPGGCLAAGSGLFVGTVHPGEKGGHVLALWPGTSEKVWATAIGMPVSAPLAAFRGQVYAACADGSLAALRAGSGEVAWRQPLGSQLLGWPVAAGDWVAAATERGELLVYEAASGELRGRAELPGLAGPPVVSGEHLVCRSGAEVRLLGPDGTVLRPVTLPSTVADVAAAEGGCLGLLEDGSVWSIPVEGEPARLSDGASGVRSMAIGDGVLVLAGERGVTALTLSKGGA
jgi:outer membrane protein assembly factor BamB